MVCIVWEIDSVEVGQPERLGALNRPHHLSIYPPWQGPDHPDGCRIYALPNCEVGGLGLIRQDADTVLAPTDCYKAWSTKLVFGVDHGPDIPVYRQWLETERKNWIGALLDADAEVIAVEEPAATVINPNLVYGHFLLEMLPRLHLLSVARDLGVAFRLAFPRGLPYGKAEWLLGFIRLYIPEAEVLWYDPAHQRVRAPCILSPTMLHLGTPYRYHPAMAVAAADVKRRVGVRVGHADPSRRLYLSRSRFPRTGWRQLANEEEIEAVFRNRGFDVLHPQEMTLSDQLQAYHDAEVLAGPYGSQMHNSLFAGRGARVIVLNEINNLQRLLCEWLGQDLTVILPDDGVPRTHAARPSEAAYRVDPADVASVLDRV